MVEDNWHVLMVKTGRDAQVAECFSDAYSPIGSRIVIHKRFKTKLHKEYRLFPSYVFVKGASDGVVPFEARRAGARKFIGPTDRPYPLPLTYVENLRREELAGSFDSRRRPEVGETIRIEVFGSELDAKVIRSPSDTIHAIANLMGRIVTVTDCAQKMVAA